MGSHCNVALQPHLIAKAANQLQRAAWAEARGATEEQLKQAAERARKQEAEGQVDCVTERFDSAA